MHEPPVHPDSIDKPGPRVTCGGHTAVIEGDTPEERDAFVKAFVAKHYVPPPAPSADAAEEPTRRRRGAVPPTQE